MMRLQRVGRRNNPSYRVVVTDKRTGPKSNKHVALLGSYNTKLNHVQIDGEKAAAWLAKGVQPSPTVHNLLVTQGVIKAKKINVLPKKSPIVDEAAIAAKQAEEEKAAADAAAAKADVEAETATETADDTAESAEATEEAAPADTEEAADTATESDDETAKAAA